MYNAKKIVIISYTYVIKKEVDIDMLIHSNAGIIFIGFIVSLWLLPRATSKDYTQKFFAYISAILLLLIATSEVMVQYPLPFYFMLGSAITLLYTLFVIFSRLTKQKQQ